MAVGGTDKSNFRCNSDLLVTLVTCKNVPTLTFLVRPCWSMMFKLAKAFLSGEKMTTSKC